MVLWPQAFRVSKLKDLQLMSRTVLQVSWDLASAIDILPEMAKHFPNTASSVTNTL